MRYVEISSEMMGERCRGRWIRARFRRREELTGGEGGGERESLVMESTQAGIPVDQKAG